MKGFSKILLSLFFVFLFPNFCRAGSVIAISPSAHKNSSIIPLEIKYINAEISIEGEEIKVRTEQVFRNPNNFGVKGVFLFPYHKEENSIQKFSLQIDSKDKKTEKLSGDSAEYFIKNYTIIFHSPIFLKYADKNIFKAENIFIDALEEIKIGFSYTEKLKTLEGLSKFVYPLSNIDSFSSIPPKKIIINIDINSPSPIGNIYSPSHKIVINRNTPNNASVSYGEQNIKSPMDFYLYFSSSHSEIDISVLSYKEKGKDGFFSILLSPKSELKKTDIMPKDIVFVIDSSGSMDGLKIKQAKLALKYALSHLNPTDHFNIITFSDSLKMYKSHGLWEAKNPYISEANKFIDEITAFGGTDIGESLEKAAWLLEKSPNVSIIIFLTDGEATYGETDTKKIIENISLKNTARSKIFVFGVGENINAHFLDAIASDSNAVSFYLKENENIEESLSDFYDRISAPIMSSIQISFENNIGEYDIFPKNIPDLYRNGAILLTGRYRTAKITKIYVNGIKNNKNITISKNAEFNEETHQFFHLPYIWSAKKIGYLLNKIRFSLDKQEKTKKEIFNLSKKYAVLTPYTSFLIDPPPKYGDFSPYFYQNQVFENLFKKYSFMDKRGLQAIKVAKTIKSLKEAKNVSEIIIDKNIGERVKRIGSKVFYLWEPKFVDSYFSNQKTIKIEYFSKKYFSFLLNFRELAKYFSISKNLVLCTDEKCYETGENIIEPEADPETGFIDTQNHWARMFIKKLSNKGIIKGYEDPLDRKKIYFLPDQPITRAEFLKITLLGLGFPLDEGKSEELFTDINETDWFYNYVLTAKKKGIVSGYKLSSSETVFRPNQEVTRAEALKILLSAKGVFPKNTNVSSFSDVTSWEVPWVEEALSKGIINGYSNNTFRPKNPITRAEACKIISLIMNN